MSIVKQELPNIILYGSKWNIAYKVTVSISTEHCVQEVINWLTDNFEFTSWVIWPFDLSENKCIILMKDEDAATLLFWTWES